MNPSEHPSLHGHSRRKQRAADMTCRFVLVVMEDGSAWPSYVDGGCSTCIALRQASGESCGELLRRAYDRIRAAESVGHTIDVAVLSCNDSPDRGALESRVPMARALLGAVLRGGGGRLDLVARSKAPTRTRQSVMALAGALTEALVGSSASVSARFAEELH